MAYKIRQNAFPAEAPPLIVLGQLTTLPDYLVGWGGHLFAYPAPLGARHSLPLAPRFRGIAPNISL